jgi:5-(carboxyamino)imidazole ribonucleotide synthase
MLELGRKIGIIGGGQLSRMLALAAYNLGYKVAIYTNDENSSAAQVTKYVTVGDYFDEKKILEFASEVDVLTYEFENISYEILGKIELQFPKKLKPNSKSLFISNNRLREKDFFNNLGVKTTNYKKVSSMNELREIIFKSDFSFPVILKTCEDGYDGKGQYLIKDSYDLNELGGLDFSRELIIEQKIDFKTEVSLILARDEGNHIEYFPIPQNIHKNGILHTSFVPNNLSEKINYKIFEIGRKVIEKLNYIGLMAIEFFIDKNDEIIVNEMAPRVHNSGHYTMNACNISQFEQHIRAVCGLNLKSVELFFNCKMRNLIGDDLKYSNDFIGMKNAFVYIYDKGEVKNGRKMGHINFIKESNIQECNSNEKNQQSELWDETLLNELIQKKEI